MLPGRPYLLKIGAKTVGASIAAPKYKVNVNTLEHLAAKTLQLNEIGVCNLNLDQPIAFDPYAENRDTGGFILIDRMTNDTVGAGLLHFALRRSQNIHWQAIEVNKQAHAALKGQKPCVVWFTGLSGSGKSTIANLVEKKLHALGRHTYLLDGDNVRHGLNKDLGFTEADRVENIRRVAEVARLMVDAGLIVLVSFISPFRAERRLARERVEAGEFCEVFVDTPLAVAEQRDPKGLYKKARRGDLKNFTGIDSPYEPPEHAEVRIDTVASAPEDAAEAIIAHLRGWASSAVDCRCDRERCVAEAPDFADGAEIADLFAPMARIDMTHFYAFNGDADGLCALQQLRLVDPRDATLVTGVKRDIQLLRRVNAAAGDEVTVLDISLDANRDDLRRLLDAGASVRYFDHHYAGELPQHPNFEAHIEESSDVCTSTLVDRHLAGRHRPWAIVAAFGDNLKDARHRDGEGRRHRRGDGRHAGAARHPPQLQRLRETRSAISVSIPRIWRGRCCRSRIPMEFIRHSPAYARLGACYEEDMQRARALEPARQVPGATVVVLPDEAWARRAIGVLANELTLAQPDCAIAILSPKPTAASP